jgi:deazaflavin-dependent oxidoreductase (nitroreductase family)
LIAYHCGKIARTTLVRLGAKGAFVEQYRESTHARQSGIGWGPKIVRAVGHRQAALPVRRLVVAVDRALYRLTGGRYLSSAMARIPSLALLVRNPRGMQVVVPLQFVVIGSETYVLGTNWGRPEHPRWTDWLLADAVCEVNIVGRRQSVVAELVPAEARAELWSQIVDISPYYERCQCRSGRQLRIFRLAIRE